MALGCLEYVGFSFDTCCFIKKKKKKLQDAFEVWPSFEEFLSTCYISKEELAADQLEVGKSYMYRPKDTGLHSIRCLG